MQKAQGEFLETIFHLKGVVKGSRCSVPFLTEFNTLYAAAGYIIYGFAIKAFVWQRRNGTLDCTLFYFHGYDLLMLKYVQYDCFSTVAMSYIHYKPTFSIAEILRVSQKLILFCFLAI